MPCIASEPSKEMFNLSQAERYCIIDPYIGNKRSASIPTIGEFIH